ncbi:MAG: ABC transporter permease [Chloroflexota bacterium]
MLKGVLRKKIRSDLFDNLSRTIQAVLTIAIGSLAVGAIIGATALIQSDITANWLPNQPAPISFRLGDGGIQQDLVETMEKFDEVERVEGEITTSIKWRRSPDETWRPAQLRAREDYTDQKLFTLRLEAGDWPTNKIITVNRGYGIEAGETIYLEIDGKDRQFTVGGVTWMINGPPPAFSDTPAFFATKSYFTDLTGQSGFTTLSASIPGEYNEEKAKVAALRLEDEIDGQGVTVSPGTFDDTKVIDPTKHPAQGPIDGIFFILQIMAYAALILGLFLVFNTITAIISQQVPQIGVLKAIGATQGQILLIYYMTVFIYGCFAALVSIPLGVLGAHGLRSFMVGFIGMDVGPFSVSIQAILVQLAISLLSPLLIATYPILQGAGITVREAISTYGLTGGGGWIDRLMAKLTFISRMVSMAVSNTFRNKVRVVMTQITLVGAGILFISVMSTQTSISFTYRDVLFDILNTNIILGFEQEERIEAVEQITTESDPNVSETEMWASSNGDARVAGQAEAFDDRNVSITGIPIPSTVYNPRIDEGRWLTPDDTYALVMNSKEAAEIGVTVGDWVTFDIPRKRASDWQVVGLLFDPLNERRIIVPRETLLIEIRQVGQARDLYVTTASADEAQDLQVAGTLRRTFDSRGYDLVASNADTLQQTSDETISSLNIIIYLLLIMAVIIAIVGAISLSGVLSINVLERRVEIGILRSIGASNRSIGTLFITEGLILAWLSWLIVVPLSIPVSTVLAAAVALVINTDFVFDYSINSVWIWFVIVTILGVIASWFPARGAISVSIRESLSYE